MDELKPLLVFAETVASGSMSLAARRLGMSPSAVSQTIRSLEAKEAITLLHRSTRKLSLTSAGERFYPHCKAMVDAANAASASLQLAREAPTGELRVSAPVGFVNHVAPAFASLLAEAPQLRLNLHFDDHLIDLIDARIDLAVQAGELSDSSWVARHLCDFEIILCASPSYLDRHGAPTIPSELVNHQWLAPEIDAKGGGTNPSSESRPKSLHLSLKSQAKVTEEIHVKARIVCNNQVSLQQMCEHGLGIARLARADIASLLQSGSLITLLPEWQLDSVPIWALTSKRQGQAAKVRIALNYLRRHFANLPGTKIQERSSERERL